MRSRDGDRMLHFWLEQLAGDLPVLQLPLNRYRSLLCMCMWLIC